MVRFVLGGVAIFSVWTAAVVVLSGRGPTVGSGPLAALSDSFGGEAVAAPATSSVAVRVRSESCNGVVVGSGFVVDGRVFTNRHVVGDAAVVAISTATSPQVSVDVPVLGRSGRIDAAVIGPVPRALAVESVTLAGSDAEVGDVVQLVGWVDGRLRQREGTVHLFTDGAAYGVDGQVMLIDPATTFGYSGGPVVNGDGEVVAMLQSVDLATSLTLAIPVSELRESAANDLYGVGSPLC